MRNFYRRVLESLMFGRFEPIQTILALSMFAHGLWILFPRWSFALPPPGVVQEVPTIIESPLGFLMVIVGAGSLTGLSLRNDSVVKKFDLTEFMLWVSVMLIAIVANGIAGIIWMPYATIALFSAFAYLNMRMKEQNGDR